MHAIDRMSDVRDSWRERRLRIRNEDLDQQNREIRTQMHALRDELDHERAARTQMLEALQRIKPETVKIKSRGGLLRLLVIGGAAYIVGAKAGRERYEQIRGWWEKMRPRGSETFGSEDERSTTRNDSMPLSA